MLKDYAERLAHFDLFDPDQEKWDLLAYAREHCPVVHSDADGAGWLVTRFQDVRTVLENPAVFSARGAPPRPAPIKLPPLDADPPFQQELRKILNPYFGPGRLKKHEGSMRDLAASLVDGWATKGECEFIADFAIPFSAGVLARVIFNETNPDRVRGAVRTVSRAAEEASPEAIFDLAVLAGEYLDERGRSEERSDDVIDGLLFGTVGDGRMLTDDERVGAMITLFLGGLDTTRATFGNILGHVARDPALEGRLRRPGWDRRDLDEFIRLDSAVTVFGRTVVQPAVLGGIELRPGDRVIVHYASANRDESKFENANRLDFDTPRSGHAGFGLGVHRCLGSHLARIQLAIGFDEIFKRITAVRLQDPEGRIEYATGFVHGPERLPITFDPTS